MTAQEFNTKYDTYIERIEYVNREGAIIVQKFGGLEFDIPEVTEYLDRAFEGLIQIPNFTYSQIKLKYGMTRFYSTAPSELNYEIEKDIDNLIKKLES